MKSKKERSRDTERILSELGFVRSRTSDSPRTTGGILFTPIADARNLPRKSYTWQGDSDEEAAEHFNRYEPKPQEVMRFRNMYFMPAPELPNILLEEKLQ